jgi:hypothetical protein
MENKNLKMILDTIVESAQDEDQELLIETLDSINDDCWKDIDSAIAILDTFLTNVSSDFFVYPIKFIPDYLFGNENFINRYVNLLCWFYNDELLDYNFTELIPSEVLKNKELCKKFLSCNYFEVVDDVPEEFWGDQSVVFASLEGLENHIEYRENTSMLTPPDKTECISYLFEKVSKDLSNNKDFIIDFLSNYYFIETFEVVYKWIDKSLWLDKEFVKKVLDKDCELSDEYLKEVMKDEGFKEWFNGRYGF